MVEAVRRGQHQRPVAEKFQVALSTLQYWLRRVGEQRLNRVDWSDRTPGPHAPANRTPPSMEEKIVTVRTELREKSLLGEFGAEAIRRALEARGARDIPSARTIHRILDRRGALDAGQRIRRPAPPRGWYLPDLVLGEAELDSFDFVEDLVIEGGPEVDILTGISLHGSLPCSWPMAHKAAKKATDALVGHWRAFGCPSYAQFDNDTCFQGPHQHPDTLGRVTRLCLGLGVVPVFAPPREMGFQASIENFNGRWQAKVWERFHHKSLRSLQGRSERYIEALRTRCAAQIEAAPERSTFPKRWRLDLQSAPRGRVIYLRRTSDRGTAEVLGHSFQVDRSWPNRLVRAEVDLIAGMISFYALRRRDPYRQPLLKQIAHTIPHRPFQE